jgi:hypothetical protein
MISRMVLTALTGALTVSGATLAVGQERGGPGCDAIPLARSLFSDLQSALQAVVDGQNAGLSNEMWASIVDRDGIVCAVTFSGQNRGAQWPGSRVISAQKANTANAFSLDADDGSGIALSSGNLYGQVQPGGSLFGLQFSNPVDPGRIRRQRGDRGRRRHDQPAGLRHPGRSHGRDLHRRRERVRRRSRPL